MASIGDEIGAEDPAIRYGDWTGDPSAIEAFFSVGESFHDNLFLDLTAGSGDYFVGSGDSFCTYDLRFDPAEMVITLPEGL